MTWSDDRANPRWVNVAVGLGYAAAIVFLAWIVGPVIAGLFGG